MAKTKKGKRVANAFTAATGPNGGPLSQQLAMPYPTVTAQPPNAINQGPTGPYPWEAPNYWSGDWGTIQNFQENFFRSQAPLSFPVWYLPMMQTPPQYARTRRNLPADGPVTLAEGFDHHEKQPKKKKREGGRTMGPSNESVGDAMVSSNGQNPSQRSRRNTKKVKLLKDRASVANFEELPYSQPGSPPLSLPQSPPPPPPRSLPRSPTDIKCSPIDIKESLTDRGIKHSDIKRELREVDANVVSHGEAKPTIAKEIVRIPQWKDPNGSSRTAKNSRKRAAPVRESVAKGGQIGFPSSDQPEIFANISRPHKKPRVFEPDLETTSENCSVQKPAFAEGEASKTIVPELVDGPRKGKNAKKHRAKPREQLVKTDVDVEAADKPNSVPDLSDGAKEKKLLLKEAKRKFVCAARHLMSIKAPNICIQRSDVPYRRLKEILTEAISILRDRERTDIETAPQHTQ